MFAHIFQIAKLISDEKNLFILLSSNYYSMLLPCLDVCKTAIASIWSFDNELPRRACKKCNEYWISLLTMFDINS